ncbi:hypothetical protein DL95DRAFT_459246 [Leptodontidium sp. 2 PMI_412]|nr:hypothetical protein DL95DRAFT_459246 [Leptodontidium sp. 2 PMI_412]
MNLVVLRDITRYTNEKRALALSLENHSSQHVVERLYDLLHDTCGIFKATDPHDLVYGLPGLLGATIPNEIYPDYSLSVSKVFHQYTMYMIKGTNTLDFLCSLKRDLPDVPSWVSDWRHTIFNEKGSKKSFAGSLDTGISEDGEQLIVSGVCLGQVARVVYPTAIAGAITATQIGADIDHPNQQSTEDAPNDVARHVLTIFRGMQELKRSCILHFTSATTGYWKQYWGQLWLQDMEECQNLFELLESTSELRLEEIVRYKPAAILMIIGDTIRRLARTGFAILEGGQLIDTSRIDEPILDGDLICFLRGMTRPCILRKARQYFTLVGGCNMSSFKEDSLIELLLSRIGLIGLF